MQIGRSIRALLAFAMMLCAAPLLAADNRPIKPIGADGKPLNLDFETGRQIMGVLEKLHREKGQTIVMVTHDRSLARQADRVLVLVKGRLERADATASNDQ